MQGRRSGVFPETNLFLQAPAVAGWSVPRAQQTAAGQVKDECGNNIRDLGRLSACPPGAGMTMLLPLLLIPILYFLMIRPQQKRQKQWQSMLASIKSGDRITTAGGIRGIILSIKDDASSFAWLPTTSRWKWPRAPLPR